MIGFSKYDIKLYEYINNIDTYPFKSGGEGYAYFVDENFVVKRYFKKVDNEFDLVFDDYCKEMQEFANRGMNVPKIYAWVKVPNFYARRDSGCVYDYYVLQERVKGRQLFYGFLEDIYPLCEKLCSNQEFDNAVENPSLNRELFTEIFHVFVNDFVYINEYLCSVPEYQIDELLYTVYTMCLDGRYSVPDIFPANILFNEAKIHAIDSHLDSRDGQKLSKKDIDTVMTSGLVWLFFYNNFVTRQDTDIIDENDIESKNYLKENRLSIAKPCKEAMIRLIKRMNAVCSKPKITNRIVEGRDFMMLKEMLSRQDASEIMSNFERDF